MGSPYPLLDAMPDVTLRWTIDPAILQGRRARWFPRSRTIAIDSSMRRLKARCSLAHELAHVVLGHPCSSGDAFYDHRTELAADQFAARHILLDDLDELASEIATTCNHGHAAANLRVTLDMFEARLAGLTDAERRFISRKVWAVHDSLGA